MTPGRTLLPQDDRGMDISLDCNCDFEPFDDGTEYESTHYKRRCHACGEIFWSLHCIHEQRLRSCGCDSAAKVKKVVSGRPPELRPCGWCGERLSSEQDRTHRKECPQSPRMLRAKERLRAFNERAAEKFGRKR